MGCNRCGGDEEQYCMYCKPEEQDDGYGEYQGIINELQNLTEQLTIRNHIAASEAYMKAAAMLKEDKCASINYDNGLVMIVNEMEEIINSCIKRN